MQQVAFSLAREVCKRWQADQGNLENSESTITPQILFPKVAYAAKRFLLEKVKCIGTAEPCDVLLVGKYQQSAVNSLYEAIRKGGICGNLELPRIAKGAAGRGSTDYVDYHTTKAVYPVTKCHLNLMSADTKRWEQSAGFALDMHPGVIKWVKNEHLGFTIPYRKNGIPSIYTPDFIADLDIGLNLIIETKGQYNDNADIKAKAAERWVKAVNQAGDFGLWQYVVAKDPTDIPEILNEYCVSKWDATQFQFGT